MVSAEELRDEIRRLTDEAKQTSDLDRRCRLALRCVDLAQRAELVERVTNNPEILERYIRYCQHKLAGGLTDKPYRDLIEFLLCDLNDLLIEVRRPRNGSGRRALRPTRRPVETRASNAPLSRRRHEDA
jgi:hypothetical protein